jgi:type II secretory pathway pseudopilin PulG
MLVVLTIIALVAGFAAATFSRKPGHVERTRLVQAIRKAAEAARHDAEQTGTVQMLQTPAWPGAGIIRFQPVLKSGTGDKILFFPDGSSTGAIFFLNDSPVASIDWLTGRMRDATPGT